jgi:hypothetical protein
MKDRLVRCVLNFKQEKFSQQLIYTESEPRAHLTYSHTRTLKGTRLSTRPIRITQSINVMRRTTDYSRYGMVVRCSRLSILQKLLIIELQFVDLTALMRCCRAKSCHILNAKCASCCPRQVVRPGLTWTFPRLV